MRENDTASFWFWDPLVATALLTRLPLPRLPDAAFARQAQAVWAFPLVGLLIGLFVVAIAHVGLEIGLPVVIVAGVCLGTQIVLTGAMHEDGLADTTDGFWGGWDVDRRLEIMKDSHIGPYGVLALILSVGLRWAALGVVVAHNPWLVVAVAVASRMGLPMIMHLLPRVRPGGLSDSVGRPPVISASAALGIGVMGIMIVAPAAVVWVMLAMTLAGALCIAVAQLKIGGQTGDVLGATQQVTEICCLLALAAVLSG